MAWELEGLIAHLLMLISCAGEHGCSVEALLGAIRDSSAPSGSSSQTVKQETQPDRAASTVWRWLVERNDVSVGRERRYNHLALHELLALPQAFSPAGDGNALQQAPRHAAPASSEGDAVRVYTTESTMWEAITGHAVDYKRVPRSEWLLLLGIASSKSEGILQGDLCRLVDQDKRSVPKRTDALSKKGYIAKRTTLVRGTKTSKMWLKSFAPPLSKENKDSTATPKAEMNLSRQMLAENLDPVPWHTHWTGEYIDYAALATTIMAVAKEWDVIRVRHLKAKLGILGMRWQMKILANTCRFLNSRGAIQYVAAKLEDRVFKDCVRYHRDLTPDDWSLYLATGKRPGKPARGDDAGDGDDDDDQVSPQHANNLRLSMCPPWTLDKPLPHAIARIVQCLGDGGMSNSDIYTLTLGATFNRFLSSMTGSMSTSDIQPSGLKHLQLRSEHFRAGKVASYLFFMPPIPALKTAAGDSVDTGAGPVGAEVYGFSPATAEPPVTEKPMTLTEICGLQLPRKGIERQQAQRPGTRREDASGQPGEGLPAEREMEHVSGKPSPDVLEEGEAGPRQGPSLMVKLKLAPEAMLRALAQGQPPRPRKSPQEGRESPGPGPEGDDGAANAAERGEPAPRPEDDGDTAPRAASTRRGRGRGRGGRGAAPSSSRQWRCDKCGGSWKNSVGLKYHLEKSQTSCNASYVPTAPPRPSRGGRQVSFFRPRASDSPGESESESESAGLGSNGTGIDATTWPSSTSVRRSGPSVDIRIREQVDEKPHPRNAFSPLIAESWQCPGTGPEGPGRFSPPHANPRLLLDDGASRRRQVPPLEGQGRWDTLVATSSEKDSGRDAVESIEEAGVAAIAPDADAEASQDESRRGQAQDETPGPGRSGRGADGAPDGAPDDAGRGRRAKTNKETCNRIRSLVQDMLKERGGAMLGGKALWHVVTAAWSTVFPDAAVPSERDCQSAVNGMLRNKAVTEHWRVFRDDRGMFAKCQLILGPGVDAFSPECLSLMDQVKHARLRLAQGDETGNAAVGRGSRQRVRGRRPLAKEVAVLDAPIYAAQLAAKREAEDAGDSPRRAKRVKYSAKPKPGERDGLSPSPERRGAGGIRPAASGRSRRALDDVHDDALPPAALRFLEPNTQLEDDGPRSDSGETPRPPDGHSPPRRGQEELCREQGGSYVFDDITPISAASNGTSWPWLDGQQLDRLGTSFTMKGWIPYGKWFKWATLTQAVERQYASRQHRSRSSAPASSPHRRFVSRVLACLDVELLWRAYFVNAVRGEAGPHTIFVGCSVEPGEHAAWPPPRNLAWPAEGQLTPTSAKRAVSEWEEDKTWSSSLDADDSDGDDDDGDEDEAGARAWTAAMPWAAAQTAGSTATRQPRIKRVALVSRALTALPAGGEGMGKGGADIAVDSQDEVMAALVAVRSLLGGVDKAVDWGLLVSILPGVGLGGLRRFWTEARKERAALVANYTRVFQERLVAALESEELPMVDFDRPLDYDWGRLIAWTMQVARQEGFQVPGSRESLDRQYRLDDARARGDDWREKYFHVQSSFFARYEAVTSAPGAVTAGEAGEAGAAARGERPAVDVAVARSWIKSLCSTAQTKYSVQQVWAKLLELSAGSQARRSALFRAAVGQLVQQRVICRRGRRPGPRVGSSGAGGSGAGGRPYRLNEWYVSALARMAQGAKYDEAAAFKAQLDAAFGRGQALRVPYTLSDGVTLALTNLQAAGRIRLVPVDVPDIPFGFEPGNYESRKYPKSYYHFALDAVATAAYRFDADIAVLGAVVARGPPSEGPRGALPQWVDVFGRPDVERWSDVLGAFCFALATRGSMTVEAVCSALSPVLDGFEAQLVVDWGKATGVLTDFVGGMGTAVGDWWWLAVPWLRSRGPR